MALEAFYCDLIEWGGGGGGRSLVYYVIYVEDEMGGYNTTLELVRSINMV